MYRAERDGRIEEVVAGPALLIGYSKENKYSYNRGGVAFKARSSSSHLVYTF